MQPLHATNTGFRSHRPTCAQPAAGHRRTGAAMLGHDGPIPALTAPVSTRARSRACSLILPSSSCESCAASPSMDWNSASSRA
eukprot:6172156-Pleurochrysis_carterae.AAC.2